jgi:hypothetical protein
VANAGFKPAVNAKNRSKRLNQGAKRPTQRKILEDERVRAVRRNRTRVGVFRRHLPNEDRRELIADAESETAKSKPNILRLGTMLTAIAATIQTIASLQDAYDLIKATLMTFGIAQP